jgi:SanA protein
VILENRLKTGVELYRQGAAPKLLLTGDGGRHRYDEVSVMQQYALDAGVPAKDIILDRDGFDTYSSIYRAKAVYDMTSVLIVTQSYHMPRALFDARALGLQALGAQAQGQAEEQWLRDLREVAARAKDYVVCIFKPVPVQY